MRISSGIIALGAILVVAGQLPSIGVQAATAPKPTFLCASAKTGASAPACSPSQTCAVPKLATDQVRTVLAGKQVWEPYSTITASSGVYDCTAGTWSSLGALGIPLFSALSPVIPPPVTPPVVPPAIPVPVNYVISLSGQPVAAVFNGLDSTVQQCFTVTAGAKTAQACIAGSSP